MSVPCTPCKNNGSCICDGKQELPKARDVRKGLTEKLTKRMGRCPTELWGRDRVQQEVFFCYSHKTECCAACAALCHGKDCVLVSKGGGELACQCGARRCESGSRSSADTRFIAGNDRGLVQQLMREGRCTQRVGRDGRISQPKYVCMSHNNRKLCYACAGVCHGDVKQHFLYGSSDRWEDFKCECSSCSLRDFKKGRVREDVMKRVPKDTNALIAQEQEQGKCTYPITEKLGSSSYEQAMWQCFTCKDEYYCINCAYECHIKKGHHVYGSHRDVKRSTRCYCQRSGADCALRRDPRREGRVHRMMTMSGEIPRTKEELFQKVVRAGGQCELALSKNSDRPFPQTFFVCVTCKSTLLCVSCVGCHRGHDIYEQEQRSHDQRCGCGKGCNGGTPIDKLEDRPPVGFAALATRKTQQGVCVNGLLIGPVRHIGGLNPLFRCVQCDVVVCRACLICHDGHEGLFQTRDGVAGACGCGKKCKVLTAPAKMPHSGNVPTAAQVMQQALDGATCTVARLGSREQVEGAWYTCTCTADNVSICLSCLRRCHQGHLFFGNPENRTLGSCGCGLLKSCGAQQESKEAPPTPDIPADRPALVAQQIVRGRCSAPATTPQHPCKQPTLVCGVCDVTVCQTCAAAEHNDDAKHFTYLVEEQEAFHCGGRGKHEGVEAFPFPTRSAVLLQLAQQGKCSLKASRRPFLQKKYHCLQCAQDMCFACVQSHLDQKHFAFEKKDSPAVFACACPCKREDLPTPNLPVPDAAAAVLFSVRCGVCSVRAVGAGQVKQRLFRCLQCQIAVCLACQRRCHTGHAGVFESPSSGPGRLHLFQCACPEERKSAAGDDAAVTAEEAMTQRRDTRIGHCCAMAKDRDGSQDAPAPDAALASVTLESYEIIESQVEAKKVVLKRRLLVPAILQYAYYQAKTKYRAKKAMLDSKFTLYTVRVTIRPGATWVRKFRFAELHDALTAAQSRVKKQRGKADKGKKLPKLPGKKWKFTTDHFKPKFLEGRVDTFNAFCKALLELFPDLGGRDAELQAFVGYE